MPLRPRESIRRAGGAVEPRSLALAFSLVSRGRLAAAW